MMVGLDPPAPLKPSEKAISIQMSKANARKLRGFNERSKTVTKQ